MLRVIIFILMIGGMFSCNSTDYSPKPRAFYRIELPIKEYIKPETYGCPYVFEIPKYTNLQDDSSRESTPCWKNINFPQFNAKLHLTYFPITAHSTLEELVEDAREFVFKHTVKASAIDQQKIEILPQNIYGVGYEIKGNTASNYQFYVTDKKKHYLRGALYFNEKPNQDSIQPVLDFIKLDIAHLIRTIRWK